MSAKHTPGPWAVATEWRDRNPDPVSSKVHCDVQSPNARPVAELWAYGNDPALVERMRANALLIAAAPELLEYVLTEAESELPPEGASNALARHRILLARKLVAKARGES